MPTGDSPSKGQDSAAYSAGPACGGIPSGFHEAYDHLPIGYLILSDDGSIAVANRAAARLLSGEMTALPGVPFAQFFEAYDWKRVSDHLANSVAQSPDATLEVTLRPAAKETRFVQLACREAPGNQKAGIRHVAMTDISQLKRTQRMLEDINREQEAFNYSISHDLRAPLVTISNYARIVLGDYGEQLNEDAKGMIQRIESAAMRMELTLKNLLEYSLLSRDEVVVESVNLGEAVRDILVEHRGVIQEKKAAVTVAPGLPSVLGSRVIVQQLLANLLTNALKYTEAGQLPEVGFDAETHGANVVLRIADKGIGIAPEHHDRIFRMFERLHGYSRYPGTGVGLAIARRAVERMHGRIWVESQLGRGSRFFIELPKG